MESGAFPTAFVGLRGMSTPALSNPNKYTADGIGHVIGSLAYFGDADAAPLPRGLSAADWLAFKQGFERRVAALP